MKNANISNVCKNCIIPTTRPDITFDDNGVCDACRSSEKKKKIDWDKRGDELKKLVQKYKRKDGYYDCVIAVSGGKDSTFQVLKVLELGLKPLCVTFCWCDSTPEGKENLDNIAELGVDHVIFRPNRKNYKKLFAKSFLKIGDACWPCHAGIFTYPIRVAINYKIPLIIYGENPHTEYGGPAKENATLTNDWLEKYGGLCGQTVEAWFKEDGIDWKDMLPYVPPTDKELEGVTAMYLGYYINWNAKEQLKIVEKHGFKRRKKKPNNAYFDYENVDCAFVDMHDHLMYKKFGFGRATTQTSIDVRNGVLSRNEALKIAKKIDKREPDIKKFSEFTGLSEKTIKDNIKRFTGGINAK